MSNPLAIEIVDALAHPDPIEQEYGIAAIGDHPQGYGGEIIAALARIKAFKIPSILPFYCRRQFAFFARPYRRSPALARRRFRIGEEIHLQEKEFVSSVRELLAASDSTANLDQYLPVLADHVALHAEYESMLGSLFNHSVVDRFGRMARDMSETSFARQIGFAPTFRCNLSCPYCFSAPRDGPDASLEDSQLVCRWSSKAGVEKLRLYGGEPTYYRHFPELLAEARRNGLKVYLPSNLIFSEPILNGIHPSSVELIFVHLRSPDLAKGSSRQFWKNAERLIAKGVRLILRYNLCDEDWDFLTAGAQRLGLREIAFAPPVQRPTALGAKARKLWREDALLINRFGRYLRKNELVPILVRPQPLCCVPVREKVPWDMYIRHCGVHRDQYTFNALVRPDLKVALCDADIVDERPKLTDFKDWEDLTGTIGCLTRRWMEEDLWPICSDCYFRERGLCQEACLGAKPALYPHGGRD